MLSQNTLPQNVWMYKNPSHKYLRGQLHQALRKEPPKLHALVLQCLRSQHRMIMCSNLGALAILGLHQLKHH